jgi:hypothetical protein
MKLDYNKKKKSRKNKSKRPSFNRTRLNSIVIKGNANLKPAPFPRPPRRDFGHNTQQHIPKEEKSHWNGKVEMWTEPQKQRQEKVVKYEVDTDKLLRELADANKDALNEIAEKLEKEIKSESSNETEIQKKTDGGEKSTAKSASEVSEETEREEKKQTDESPEQAETDMQNEKIETEKSEDETEDKEAEPQSENVNDESQEAEQDAEPEDGQQEDPLDAPELVYMKPSFWEQLESEMADELEQMEPEEDLETPPEESEPIEEGY